MSLANDEHSSQSMHVSSTPLSSTYICNVTICKKGTQFSRKEKYTCNHISNPLTIDGMNKIIKACACGTNLAQNHCENIVKDHGSKKEYLEKLTTSTIDSPLQYTYNMKDTGLTYILTFSIYKEES